MPTVVFIRHGDRSHDNNSKIGDGAFQFDATTTMKGIGEIKRSYEFIKGAGLGAPRVIVSSPLLRCREAAEILAFASGLNGVSTPAVVYDNRLLEYLGWQAGKFMHRPQGVINMNVMPTTLDIIKACPVFNKCGSAEIQSRFKSGLVVTELEEDLKARACDFVRSIASLPKNVLIYVVSHSFTIGEMLIEVGAKASHKISTGDYFIVQHELFETMMNPPPVEKIPEAEAAASSEKPNRRRLGKARPLSLEEVEQCESAPANDSAGENIISPRSRELMMKSQLASISEDDESCDDVLL
jgi:broad specificity phosphatase PhoE